MSAPVLACSGVSRSYRSGDSVLPVLNGIDLRVAKGEQIRSEEHTSELPVTL